MILLKRQEKASFKQSYLGCSHGMDLPVCAPFNGARIYMTSGTSISFCWCVVKDPQEALELGECWQDAIEDLCDSELLFRQANFLARSLDASRPLWLWDEC